ncbi:unnamed protein product [Prunus brigantina]
MSDGELIDYILDGLGHEYKQFTTSLHLRPSLTFDDFFGLLIQEEHLLKRMSSISLSTGTSLTSDCNPNDQQQISHNMQYTPNNNSNQRRGRDRNWNSNVAGTQFVPTPTDLFPTTVAPPLPLQIIVRHFFQFHYLSHLSNSRKSASVAIDKATHLTSAHNMEILLTWPSPTLLPSLHLGALSPYENLFQRPPDYTFLKTFGCTCFPLLVPYNKHKLIPKSTKCVFIGYDGNYKGYRCLDMASGWVYISRHVTFDEHTFPYHITPSQQPTIQVPSLLPTVIEPVLSKDLLHPFLPPAPPLATVPSSHQPAHPLPTHLLV